ncbi:tetratricopeptide repeat protein [Thermodesulfobacteriota bacterium]
MNRRTLIPGLIVIFMTIISCAAPQKPARHESSRAKERIGHTIPAAEKIDIGESRVNDEWKIKVEYVKYEGTRVEIKNEGFKTIIFGDAVPGFQLVRVRVHLERLDGKPIRDSFLNIPVTIKASDGKYHSPAAARNPHGEFYNYVKGGKQNILIPLTEKSEFDYVFLIPASVKAEGFNWPNMRAVSMAGKRPATPFSHDAQLKVDRAEDFMSKGRYDDAIREAGKALDIDPNNTKALKTRAESYRMKGKYDEAIRDADKLLRLQPNNAYTLRTRGSSFLKKHQNSEAILDLSRALSIEPNNVFALENRAEAYRMKNDFDRAIQDATKALEISPKDTFALKTRGEAYRGKGNYEAAIQDATTVLGISPKDTFAIRTRAEAYRGVGNYEAAIRDADRALQIQSNDAFSLRTRCAALWALGKYVEAIQDSTKALEIDPNSAFALKYRADSHRMNKNYDQAIRDADRALAITPDDAFALRARAGAHKEKGNYDLAIQDAKRSLEIEPGNELAIQTLADAERIKKSSNNPKDKSNGGIELCAKIIGKDGNPLAGVEFIVFKVKNKVSVVQEVREGKVSGPSGKSDKNGNLIIKIPKGFLKTGDDFTFGNENSWLTKNGGPVLFTLPAKTKNNRVRLGNVYLN